MLGVFAEFETNLRRERQLEGIAKAKLRTPMCLSWHPQNPATSEEIVELAAAR